MNPDENYKDIERQARLAAEFLDTEYGADLINAIHDMLQSLHRQAETAIGIEDKAMLVERAAGVRDVLNIIQTEANMYLQGQFKETEEVAPE